MSEDQGLPIGHGGVIALTRFFCCWWCPVMAADRVISLTTAVAVSEGVATAAVLV